MTGACGQAAVQAGSSKQIWLGGVDPVAQSERHISDPSDYMDLFKPDAAWPTGAAATNVFKVGTAFILRGTDDQGFCQDRYPAAVFPECENWVDRCGERPLPASGR